MALWNCCCLRILRGQRHRADLRPIPLSASLSLQNIRLNHSPLLSQISHRAETPLRPLKTELHPKLQSPRPVRVDRVQEGSSRYAVGSGAFEPGRVLRPGVTAHQIVSRNARIIGVVHPKLRVVEKVEGLGAKLQIASLPDLEVPEQRNIEIQSARVIEKVSPGIAK